MVIDILTKLKAEVARLESERIDRERTQMALEAAICALEGETAPPRRADAGVVRKPLHPTLRLVGSGRGGGLTPDGRRRLSLSMKRRWASGAFPTKQRKAS